MNVFNPTAVNASAAPNSARVPAPLTTLLSPSLPSMSPKPSMPLPAAPLSLSIIPLAALGFIGPTKSGFLPNIPPTLPKAPPSMSPTLPMPPLINPPAAPNTASAPKLPTSVAIPAVSPMITFRKLSNAAVKLFIDLMLSVSDVRGASLPSSLPP